MDFVDEVRTRSGRFAGRVKHWESEPPTEEATKTSLILPFIQMLGYDICWQPAKMGQCETREIRGRIEV